MKLDLGYINQVTSVTVQLNEGEPLFNYIILKKSKDEISFGKIGKRILSPADLAKEIGTRHPVLLHFTGKGILNRKIKREENYRHSILLNAQLNDFYFSDYLEEKVVYSSVIRKTVVDDVMTQLARNKLNVIGISSGPFITVPFVSFFDRQTFVSDDVELFTEKGLIKSHQKIADPHGCVMIGDTRIDFDVLGAVARGAAFFKDSGKLVLADDDPVFLVNLEEAKQKSIFFRFGMFTMVFFLALLAANYFYLGHLNDKIENNFVILAEFEEQLGELSLLQEEKERKENLLRSSGLLSTRFLSFYLAELSNSVPADISFETVTVRPLMNEIKKKQKIEFYDHLVQVTGYSKTSDILSRWIEELKKEEWLSKVDILDYTYEKSVGNFELEIEVN